MDSQQDKKKILVIDDDPLMLRTIRGWLSEDYNVSVVPSGQTALAFLQKFTPDLILLDFEMPVMSGPQLLEKLRADPEKSKIPVMFLTGKDDKKKKKKINSLNTKGVILKNRTPDQVKEIIADFFNKQ